MKVRQIPKKAFEPEAEITVPHLNGEITFVAPYFGSGSYATVRTGIESAGLLMPTLAETSSLAYDSIVVDSKGRYAEKVRNLMKQSWLRASNAILYVPKNELHEQGGAYIVDMPDFAKEQISVNESDLIKRMSEGDNSVRFVPFGYKLERQTPLELETNPFVVGLAGKIGAEKLAATADKFSGKPYVWSLDNVSQPTLRFAWLGSDFDLDGNGLYVGGGWVDGVGCAFGVSPSSEAGAQKK